MKKIGKFNLIQDNKPCTIHCKCGWNIHIGGTEEKDYKKLKKILKEWGKKLTK